MTEPAVSSDFTEQDVLMAFLSGVNSGIASYWASVHKTSATSEEARFVAASLTREWKQKVWMDPLVREAILCRLQGEPAPWEAQTND